MVEAGGNTRQVGGAAKSFSVRLCAPCVRVCVRVFVCVSREECHGWPGRHCVGRHSGQWGRQSWRTHLVSEGCLCLDLLLNYSEDAGLWFFLSFPLSLSSFRPVPTAHTLQLSFLYLLVYFVFWVSLHLSLHFPIPSLRPSRLSYSSLSQTNFKSISLCSVFFLSLFTSIKSILIQKVLLPSKKKYDRSPDSVQQLRQQKHSRVIRLERRRFLMKI